MSSVVDIDKRTCGSSTCNNSVEPQKNTDKRVRFDISNSYIDHDNHHDDDDDDDDDDEHVKFWFEDPNVLLNPKYIFEFFPTENMTYNQKLNSITRIVILLAVVSFTLTKNYRLIVVSVLTISSLVGLHFFKKNDKIRLKNKMVESFSDNVRDAIILQNGKIVDPSELYQKPSINNPFANVMISDYDSNPNKKPAAPSFDANVNSVIVDKTKQMINKLNPSQPNMSNTLFKDLGEKLSFEQSMRPFYSTPNTTIPNDSGSFAEFLYGGMVSAKEGNSFALANNLSRYTLY
jgi:hypothetical protein